MVYSMSVILLLNTCHTANIYCVYSEKTVPKNAFYVLVATIVISEND